MQTQHYETNAFVPSPADRVFLYIDDHTSLSSHMNKSSWQMGWGRMKVEIDEAQGKKVGSRIRLIGRVLGIELLVEEVVMERDPPHSKVWETIGSPILLVIGAYRMGFELSPQENGSMLRAFIDYSLPERIPARWLGRLFGRYYAKWCTHQMVNDTVKHFSLA